MTSQSSPLLNPEFSHSCPAVTAPTFVRLSRIRHNGQGDGVTTRDEREVVDAAEDHSQCRLSLRERTSFRGAKDDSQSQPSFAGRQPPGSTCKSKYFLKSAKW